MVIFTHNPVFPEYRSILYWPVVFLNRIGWAGVDLFFVLSGFLVGGLLIDEYMKSGKIRIKRFIYRRGFKVWPVYYVFLIAWSLFQILFYKQSVSTIASRHWPNFLHIQNYFSSTSDIGWLWSLGVEEHFYLFLPFFLTFYLMKRKKGSLPSMKSLLSLLISVLAFGFAIRGLTWVIQGGGENAYIFIFPTHLRVDGLFAGVCLALVTKFYPKFADKLSPYKIYFIFVGALLTLIPYFYGHSQTFLYPLGLGILTIAFLSILFGVHCISKSDWQPPRYLLWVGGVFAFIGLRSYSIYVWHGFWAKPMAHRMTKLLSLTPDTQYFGIFYELIYWSVPIGLGCLSFHLIEEPFLKVRHRLFP